MAFDGPGRHLLAVLSCGIGTLVIALRGFTCLSMFSSDAAKVRLG
jgi:hypothetical protein